MQAQVWERLSPPRPFGALRLLARARKSGLRGGAELFLAALGHAGFARLVSVKRPLPELLDDSYRRRFLDEARVVVRLQHINLVPVISAGEIENQLHIVMEALEGRSLEHLVHAASKLDQTLPVPVSVFIVRELLRGLHYAHTFPGLSLVHRDVAPANIFLEWSGAVRLSDFGLATSTLKTTETAPGTVFGALGYMSPEQAQGRGVDPRSDLYACAAVLWELITGQLFRPRNEMALASLQNPEVAPPSRFNDAVDEILDGILLRALSHDRHERWRSAESMMQALSDWLAEHGPSVGQDDLAACLREYFPGAAAAEHSFGRELLASLSNPRAQHAPPGRAITPLPLEPSLPHEPLETLGLGLGLGRGYTRSGPALPSPAQEQRPGTQMAAAIAKQDLHAPTQPQQGAQDADAALLTPITTRADLVESVREDSPLQAPIAGAGSEATPALRPLVEPLEKMLPGTVLAGRYEIVDRLGRGGMGTVYLAKHLQVGRPVAIKVLTRVWSRNEDVARRFRAEARAASAAGHPNIVEVFDAGELSDGRLFLVMEHLVGQNLYEQLRVDGVMGVQEAIEIMQDVARAVKAAHDVGVVHRDLKPDNVMLVERGAGESRAIKVLDFGISATTDSQRNETRWTKPGHAVGTPEYMAPEQARGVSATKLFDVYAWGVMFFEILTARAPLTGTNFVDVMAKKNAEPAPSLRSFREDVPPGLCELVDDCLQMDPEQRPQSMGEILVRLGECQTKWARAQPTGRGRRRAWMLPAAAGFLALCVWGGLRWQERGNAAPHEPAPHEPASLGRVAQAPDPTILPSRVGPDTVHEQANLQIAPRVDPVAPANEPEQLPETEPVPQAPAPVTQLAQRDPKPSRSKVCAQLRRRVAAARRRGDPSRLLGLLQQGRGLSCWRGKTARLEWARDRVHAFKELKQWEACVSAGAAFAKDPRIAESLSLCKARKVREQEAASLVK